LLSKGSARARIDDRAVEPRRALDPQWPSTGARYSAGDPDATRASGVESVSSCPTGGLAKWNTPKHADHSLALHGTPIAGGTLLHPCVDFDEMDLARWLIDRGAENRLPVRELLFGGAPPLAAWASIRAVTHKVGKVDRKACLEGDYLREAYYAD
jgi:hypothetical protein